ncbi:F420-dependent glucose-6-phosphate dehydrogenase [Actinomadura madurae]|nr:F420-dependent glucose-6-phosphate dehydrogenase [Actinomadura madurae]
MRSVRVGLSLPPQLPPARIPRIARHAEDAGFDELWLAEDCFFAGGIAAVSAALAATDDITVVIGILPAAARNAAFTAMELAALAELYPHRVVGGLGHGMPGWMRQVGAAPRSPLTALRERLEAVRALLAGQTVSVNGDYVHLDAVKLDHPPETPPPVLAGVRGPKSLELAGRSADGVILAWPVTPGYIEHAADLVAQGRREAASPGPGKLLVGTPISLDQDKAAAAERLRPLVATELNSPSSQAHLEPTGLAEKVNELRAMCASLDEFATRIPREWIETLTVCGTAHDCANAVHALHQAGAGSVALSLPGSLTREQITHLGRELLPELR